MRDPPVSAACFEIGTRLFHVGLAGVYAVQSHKNGHDFCEGGWRNKGIRILLVKKLIPVNIENDDRSGFDR